MLSITYFKEGIDLNKLSLTDFTTPAMFKKQNKTHKQIKNQGYGVR